MIKLFNFKVINLPRDDKDKDKNEDEFINDLFENITRIFSSLFGIPIPTQNPRRINKVEEEKREKVIKNILEKENEFYIYYDIPGVNPDTIILRIKDNKVYLYARNAREIRDITELPKPVKNKIKSSNYRNGILEVIIEKKR